MKQKFNKTVSKHTMISNVLTAAARITLTGFSQQGLTLEQALKIAELPTVLQ